MRLISSFIGKNRDFRAWLKGNKKPNYSNVIFLGKCELCGRLAKGDICNKCDPLFRKWTKKIAAELAAEKSLDPSIA